jgi:transposase
MHDLFFAPQVFDMIPSFGYDSYKTIINYFDNRSTNASPESFNAKNKNIQISFQWSSNVDFFLRLTQIYA